MKIRMACEWRNLGRFAIDHFAISYGWSKGEDPATDSPQERVEPIHRHYLTTYFKASSYAEDFSDEGYSLNLNRSGQVLPFAEVSKVMELVLKEWHEKLICPYSDRLRWEGLGSSQLERLFPKPLDEPSDNNPPHADALLWNGFPKTDSVQKRYRCNWKKLDDNSFCYVPCKSTRVYSPQDIVVSWDRTPCTPYAITTKGTKNLSVVSKRGTTEEIARELMMDFLFGLVVTLNDEELNRVYKMTFRLDEETGKESDFGVEITVKGCIDDIVESWDRQRIMTYARSRGWNRSRHALEEAETLWTDQALREMIEGMFCGNDNSEFDSRLIFRDRIKRTVLIRALYNSISSLPSYFWSRDTSEELEEEDEARLAFIAKFDEIISKS